MVPLLAPCKRAVVEGVGDKRELFVFSVVTDPFNHPRLLCRPNRAGNHVVGAVLTQPKDTPYVPDLAMLKTASRIARLFAKIINVYR